MLGGRRAPDRLLLETVQNVDGFAQPDGVDGAVGVPHVVLDDLEDAGAVKALQRLGLKVLRSDLGEVERKAEYVLDLIRQGPEILSRFLAEATQKRGLTESVTPRLFLYGNRLAGRPRSSGVGDGTARGTTLRGRSASGASDSERRSRRRSGRSSRAARRPAESAAAGTAHPEGDRGGPQSHRVETWPPSLATRSGSRRSRRIPRRCSGRESPRAETVRSRRGRTGPRGREAGSRSSGHGPR